MAPPKAEVLLLKTDASTASAAATLREALASTRGQPRVALMSKAKTVDALISWLDKETAKEAGMDAGLVKELADLVPASADMTEQMQKLFVDAALARSLAEALRRVVVALVDRVQGCDETHAAMEAIIAAATELAMSGDALLDHVSEVFAGMLILVLTNYSVQFTSVCRRASAQLLLDCASRNKTAAESVRARITADMARPSSPASQEEDANTRLVNLVALAGDMLTQISLAELLFVINRAAFKGKPVAGPPGASAILGGAAAFGPACIDDFHSLLCAHSVTTGQRFAAMRALVARLNVSLPGRLRRVFSFAPDQVGVRATRLDVPGPHKKSAPVGGWSLVADDYALLVDFNVTGLTLHRLLSHGDPDDVADTEAVDIPYTALRSVMRTGGGEAPQPPVWQFSLDPDKACTAAVGEALCTPPADEDEDLVDALKAMSADVRAQAIEAQKEARKAVSSGHTSCLVLRFARADAADLEARVVPTMLACNPDIVTSSPGTAFGGRGGSNGGCAHPSGAVKMSTAVMVPRGARPAVSGATGAGAAVLDSRRGTALLDTAGTGAAVTGPAAQPLQMPPGLYDAHGGDAGLDSQAQAPRSLNAVIQAAGAAGAEGGCGRGAQQRPRVDNGAIHDGLPSQHDAGLTEAIGGEEDVSELPGQALLPPNNFPNESLPLTDPAPTAPHAHPTRAPPHVPLHPSRGHLVSPPKGAGQSRGKAALPLTTSAQRQPPALPAPVEIPAPTLHGSADAKKIKTKAAAAAADVAIAPKTAPPAAVNATTAAAAATATATGKRKAAVAAAAALEKHAHRGVSSSDDPSREQGGGAAPAPLKEQAHNATTTGTKRGAAKATGAGAAAAAAFAVPPPVAPASAKANKPAATASARGKPATGGAAAAAVAAARASLPSDKLPADMCTLAKQLFIHPSDDLEESFDDDEPVVVPPPAKKARRGATAAAPPAAAAPAHGGGGRRRQHAAAADLDLNMDMDIDFLFGRSAPAGHAVRGAAQSEDGDTTVTGTAGDDDGTIVALQRVVETARQASQAAAKRAIAKLLDAAAGASTAAISALAERQAAERAEMGRTSMARVSALKRKRDEENQQLVAAVKRFQGEIRTRAAALERNDEELQAASSEASAAAQALAQKHIGQVARVQKELERHLKEKEAEVRQVEAEAKQNTGVKAALLKLLKCM